VLAGRIGGDYQPQPTAVESIFWARGVINPVLGLFVGPTGNRVILAGSARRGQTVWIAVVRMQMNHADSTAMGSDERPMMICACKRERTEEREPRGQCYCREFHDFVVGVAHTNNKWTFCLIFPLKSSLSAMEPHDSGLTEAAAGVKAAQRAIDKALASKRKRLIPQK
jgi:hypothetical protein